MSNKCSDTTNLSWGQKTFVWLRGIWSVCQMGQQLICDLLQCVDYTHNQEGSLNFAHVTVYCRATSSFHRGSPWLHHHGAPGVAHHVSRFTHRRASHVHRGSSHIWGGSGSHLAHVYRWGLVLRWTAHVTSALKTTKQFFYWWRQS